MISLQLYWDPATRHCASWNNRKYVKDEIVNFHKQGGKETDEIEEIKSWDLSEVKTKFLEIDGEKYFSPSGLVAIGVYLMSGDEITKEQFDEKILSSLSD